MKKILRKTLLYKHIKYYRRIKKLLNDPTYRAIRRKATLESEKHTKRTDIINFLLEQFNRDTHYLEIGVRRPKHNFSKIKSKTKYGVDPGIEFSKNPVDFKMTSDRFFSQLDQEKILHKNIRFDVIFIDGLHLAEQVDRDIANALRYLKDDGFIVLHDCNPPSEWHAREDFYYGLTPAEWEWNGTTWKAFLKWRGDQTLQSCCIDTDWGIGILSKKHPIGRKTTLKNIFFEFKTLDRNRDDFLNLMSFEHFKKVISKGYVVQ